jgi:pyrroline-5-carboxylate reductase
MNIGFIGTGAITTALVTGLCSANLRNLQITLSTRSRNRSVLLEKKYSQVDVAESNQGVVDNSEVVFLGFLPQQAEDILVPLGFRENQLVINLLSGTRNTCIAKLIDASCQICRAVPLPFCAERIGPVVLYPVNDTAASLFNAIGTVLVAEREEHLEHLSVITALMAPYYQMLGEITDWAVQAGVPRKTAAGYTAAMYEALSSFAKKSPSDDMHQLADESMTPGGLNEMARRIVNEGGGYDCLIRALDAVCKRVSRG